MGKVLVTGANRGIGLELCKQLKSKGHEIYAVCRKASEPLKGVAKQIIEGVDVGRDQAVDQIQTRLQAEHLDIVINCAGLLQGVELDQMDFSSIERQIQVNAIGPLRVVKAVLSRLRKGAKIIMITSRMGSIEDNTSGGSYGYRMSKTALNAASKSLSLDLKTRGIAVGLGIAPEVGQRRSAPPQVHPEGVEIQPAGDAVGRLEQFTVAVGDRVDGDGAGEKHRFGLDISTDEIPEPQQQRCDRREQDRIGEDGERKDTDRRLDQRQREAPKAVTRERRE